MSEPVEQLVFNGVDGATGQFMYPAVPVTELARSILGTSTVGDDIAELLALRRMPHFGEVYGVDLENLAEAGWALVAAEGTSPDVLEALAPLRRLRSMHAGGRYREFIGPDGIRIGDTKRTFLARHRIGSAAAVAPDRVPYYLLLVGGPDSISFQLQYQLDVQYAVGRVCFDTAEEYARYAETVVEVESMSGDVSPPRTVQLFGPSHPADRATRLSATRLIAPLATELAQCEGWTTTAPEPELCTKDLLAAALSGGDASLLFTASHGVGYPCGHPDQRLRQGALVCQEWSGPLLAPGPLDPAAFFAGDDAIALPKVGTRIMMAFACFGAGTPLQTDYDHPRDQAAPDLAAEAFVAGLPRQLLAHRVGGLLAFVGHVERAWGCSFMAAGVGADHDVFRYTVSELMAGWRLGHAMQFFNDRYAALSSELHEILDGVRRSGDRADPQQLARLWTENNDARSYVVLGDPAVRLASADVSTELSRKARD